MQQKIDLNTSAADKNTSEYREAVCAIDDQIGELNTVRGRVIDITGQASNMNAELGRDINKTITINQRAGRTIAAIPNQGRGNVGSEFHTGRVLPKLHVGGMASQFMNAQAITKSTSVLYDASQCAHVCQRSVRFDNWLYIRTYHDGFHLFDDEMLFDLENDLHEQHNLVMKHRDICKEAVYYLNEWHDEMMHSMPYDVDPVWTVIREGGPFHAQAKDLQKYVGRLEETGRGWAIPELKRRYPEAFEEKQEVNIYQKGAEYFNI